MFTRILLCVSWRVHRRKQGCWWHVRNKNPLFPEKGTFLVAVYVLNNDKYFCRFLCPICKAEEKVPEGGASELELNYIHQSVTRMSKVLQQQESMCTSCGENRLNVRPITVFEKLGNILGDFSVPRSPATHAGSFCVLIVRRSTGVCARRKTTRLVRCRSCRSARISSSFNENDSKLAPTTETWRSCTATGARWICATSACTKMATRNMTSLPFTTK